MHGGCSLSGVDHPRFKHGNYTKEAIALRREVRALIAASLGTLDRMKTRWTAP
jgi:hypothetical protein